MCSYLFEVDRGYSSWRAKLLCELTRAKVALAKREFKAGKCGQGCNSIDVLNFGCKLGTGLGIASVYDSKLQARLGTGLGTSLKCLLNCTPPGGADEGAAGGAVPGDVPRLLPDHLLRGEEDGRRT